MAKKEINVTFETVTPLWTGDAWGDNREIRPSSLIGSLRFWFAFYWDIKNNNQNREQLNENGLIADNLSILEKPKENKTFQNIFQKKLLDGLSYDEAIDQTLGELKLPVPSRIFGCTGWKSRVTIKNIEFNKENLTKNELDFSFLINSEFWIGKSLFANKENINIFNQIKFTLVTEEFWWDKYLENFFGFYSNKLILVGGKKSFGFGIVKIKTNELKENGESIQGVDEALIIRKIENIDYNKNKKVLGFNFRYYLRKEESKNFRVKNFGSQGQASKVYVSNLLDDKSIYLIVINNPFGNDKIPTKIIDKYEGWLRSEGEQNG